MEQTRHSTPLSHHNRLYVIKRNGQKQEVLYDKITNRLKELCKISPSLSDYIDSGYVTQKVISGIYSGIKTTELDELAAQTCAYMSTEHPDYSTLAARISVSNLHKETKQKFSEVVDMCYKYVNPETNLPSPLYADDVYKIVMKNKERLDNAIVYDRDYNFDYFGIQTLFKSYLHRLNDRIIERPQHMYLRVGLGIHKNDIDSAIETYHYLSLHLYSHGSPVFFNASSKRPQLSSCYLLTMKDDSIEGIYDSLKQCALISKWGGGIGLSISNIRASGSYIRGTGGYSNGIVPMLKNFNSTARYCDQ